MRTESGEYVPADPRAHVELSAETQRLIDEMTRLYEQGKLFIGDTGRLGTGRS